MIIKDGENNPICCNEAMEELILGSVDAALEKHVPVVSLEEEYKIIVGEVIHPMQEEHYIEWIALEFEDGIIRKHSLGVVSLNNCEMSLDEYVDQLCQFTQFCIKRGVKD